MQANKAKEISDFEAVTDVDKAFMELIRRSGEEISVTRRAIDRKDRKGRAAETTDPAGYQCVSGSA